MEPFPYKEPHRPPALSYESPLRYDATADRHQLWAERTHRICSKARTFVLITFAIVWSIAMMMRVSGTLYGQREFTLWFALLFLAASYVVIIAIGSAQRPSAIFPRAMALSLISAGWYLMVLWFIPITSRAATMYQVYGLRGLRWNHQPSTLYLNIATLTLGILLFAAGVVCYVLLQVFAHNRTYRPQNGTH